MAKTSVCKILMYVNDFKITTSLVQPKCMYLNSYNQYSLNHFKTASWLDHFKIISKFAACHVHDLHSDSTVTCPESHVWSERESSAVYVLWFDIEFRGIVIITGVPSFIDGSHKDRCVRKRSVQFRVTKVMVQHSKLLKAFKKPFTAAISSKKIWHLGIVTVKISLADSQVDRILWGHNFCIRWGNEVVLQIRYFTINWIVVINMFDNLL